MIPTRRAALAQSGYRFSDKIMLKKRELSVMAARRTVIRPPEIFQMSIRYKIFGAFSVLILLACGLAFYGIRGIADSGDLVVRLYDGPLMGINHARSAHAGLNEAVLLMYRSSVEGTSKETVAKFEKLVKGVTED